MTPSLLVMTLLLACKGPDELLCQVEPSAYGAPTATISWTTDQPADGVVYYGAGGQTGTRTQTVRATQHRHILLGLPPDAQVVYQAMATVDDQVQTCDGTFWTEPLPSWVASPQITVQDADPQPGAWLAAVFELGTFSSQILIFDRQGVVRWYQQAEDERFVVDVQPSLDGSGLIHDQFHYRFAQDVGVIRKLSWDGSLQSETPITMGHHMFAQLPDGGLAYQKLDVRDWTDPDTKKTQSVVGDAIVEIDPTGQQTEVFNVWDWLTVQPNGFSSMPSIYPQGVDWTHGNALKYNEDADTWLLSLGNAGTVMTIDRSTGQIIQTVGAYGLPVAQGSPALEHQHDPTWLDDDHLLVFDSHFDTLVSGAYEYELVDGQLELVWQHNASDQLFALALGQARRQDDGGTWVNYGTAGVIEDVDPADQVRWRAQAAEGYGFAQVRWLPDFPTP
ncbi:MAG: hypothetical protein GXP62_09705 [Oligoflexia bacterium]|nr:hypothetical protein [Oligoflexia bacterium]